MRLDGLHRADGAPHGVRGVEHHAVGRFVRDAFGAVQAGGSTRVSRGMETTVAFLWPSYDVDDHRGVRAGAAVVHRRRDPVGAGAGVGAQHQDVLGTVVDVGGAVGAEDLVEVDALDVAVELEVDVGEAGAAEHDDARGDPGCDEERPGAPAAGLRGLRLFAGSSGFVLSADICFPRSRPVRKACFQAGQSCRTVVPLMCAPTVMREGHSALTERAVIFFDILRPQNARKVSGEPRSPAAGSADDVELLVVGSDQPSGAEDLARALACARVEVHRSGGRTGQEVGLSVAGHVSGGDQGVVGVPACAP